MLLKAGAFSKVIIAKFTVRHVVRILKVQYLDLAQGGLVIVGNTGQDTEALRCCS